MSYRFHRLGLIAAIALALLPISAGAARAAAVRAADACAGASTATNAVVRFYLAVDRRQYAAAYRCLAATVQVTLPYRTFVTGYAHTVTSRLVLADSQVPNGTPVDHVAIDLHAVDKVAGALIATTYQGRWLVSPSLRLTRAQVGITARRTVSAAPRTDVAAVFAYAARMMLDHLRADVTGDGRPDDIYVTSGQGCASCHAQQIWIYSQGMLIFQQQVDDVEIRIARNHAGMEIRTDTPGTAGLDSCCPSRRTYQEWAWTPLGFTMRSQHIVALR